jgi:hypothetical protein
MDNYQFQPVETVPVEAGMPFPNQVDFTPRVFHPITAMRGFPLEMTPTDIVVSCACHLLRARPTGFHDRPIAEPLDHTPISYLTALIVGMGGLMVLAKPMTDKNIHPMNMYIVGIKDKIL